MTSCRSAALVVGESFEDVITVLCSEPASASTLGVAVDEDPAIVSHHAGPVGNRARGSRPRTVVHRLRTVAAAPEPFIREVLLREIPDGAAGFPWTTDVVRALHATPLRLHPGCTFLVGANGAGKSTLLEAIAVAAGLGVQGGGSGFRDAGRSDERSLGEALTLARGARRPRTDFFLRAESMLEFASRIEALGDPQALAPYGGTSLHEQSHGESFLSIINHRFGPNGLYLLDEPESALSPQSLLALVARIHDLIQEGCQFVISTHAPILLALPGSRIVEVSSDGLRDVDYDDVDAVQITRLVLSDPAAMMHRLLRG